MKSTPHIVDLHIHSHYSRATSPHLNIEELYTWGKRKGIHIMGTGDFTHPLWYKELQEKLEPAEPGLFKLKDTFAERQDQFIPESCKNSPMRFVLTVEISNIYQRHDRTRRVHNVVVMSSFESAGKLNKELSQIGNLMADGRPILKMDSEDLLLRSLDADEHSLFIPAHIWTPWYAMFGSKSGFDSLEEAFGESKKHIHAIETGLSSDPFMNWRLDELQNITVVSNSDAHSPQKLAREASLIACDMDYYDMVEAIKTNDKRFVGTIEFFPEEGKYHLDGHRKCSYRSRPAETKDLQGVCPVCGKALTVGVLNRVDSLSQHPEKYIPKNHKKVEYIVPLVEIIAEVKGVKSINAKSVTQTYDAMISELGVEFELLRNIPITEIRRNFPDVAASIQNMRDHKVHIEPGYDGEFGIVSLTSDNGVKSNQLSLGIGL